MRQLNLSTNIADMEFTLSDDVADDSELAKAFLEAIKGLGYVITSFKDKVGYISRNDNYRLEDLTEADAKELLGDTKVTEETKEIVEQLLGLNPLHSGRGDATRFNTLLDELKELSNGVRSIVPLTLKTEDISNDLADAEPDLSKATDNTSVFLGETVFTAGELTKVVGKNRTSMADNAAAVFQAIGNLIPPDSVNEEITTESLSHILGTLTFTGKSTAPFIHTNYTEEAMSMSNIAKVFQLIKERNVGNQAELQIVISELLMELNIANRSTTYLRALACRPAFILPSNKRELVLDIIGSSNSGRTVLSLLILRYLRKLGINVVLKDQDGTPEHYLSDVCDEQLLAGLTGRSDNLVITQSTFYAK